MKKVCTIAFALFVILAMTTSDSQAQFKNRGVYVGPNLTLATDPVGFGGDIEFAISPNFGLGGLIRYWGTSYNYGYGSYDWTVICPQFQAAYHFMPGNQVDPYVGARLGYAIYSASTPSGVTSSAKSDMFFTGTGGMRYFFNPGLSLHGSIEFRLGGTDYFGGSLGLVAGVDFTL